jgi:hypothetical protein
MFGAYESGELVRWGPVSTGVRETQTSAGWFHLTWRAVGHVSTVNPDWYMKWYFNFGNESGLAFHEYALPGYPASHGCVRLLGRDAQWLFEWGEPWTLDRTGQRMIGEGTPVLITGFYDFESPPPWHSPAWLTSPIDLPPVLPQSAGEGPREAVAGCTQRSRRVAITRNRMALSASVLRSILGRTRSRVLGSRPLRKIPHHGEKFPGDAIDSRC